MPTVTIRQWPTPCAAGRSSTVLDAALDEAVPYPHECMSGECGTCKSRLISGEVDMASCDEAALSKAEREQGLFLACRAKPKTDVEVEWLSEAASFPVLRMKAAVLTVEAAAHDVRIVRLKPRHKLRFAAGQYARLRFANLPARNYSMASRPDEDLLEFHIRVVPDGLVSNHVALHAKPGDIVRIEGPFGAAHLRERDEGPILAAGGGTGMAPIRSIVRTALTLDSPRRIHVYAGFRHQEDVYGAEEFAELAQMDARLSYDLVLSRPPAGSPVRAGHLHDAVAADLPDLSNATIYVCGPPKMVESMRAMALERGVPAERILSDPFIPTRRGAEGDGLMGGLKRLLGLGA